MSFVSDFGFRSHCKRLMTFDFWPWPWLISFDSLNIWFVFVQHPIDQRGLVDDVLYMTNVARQWRIWPRKAWFGMVWVWYVLAWVHIHSWTHEPLSLHCSSGEISYHIFMKMQKGSCGCGAVLHASGTTFFWQDPIDIYISGFVCKLFSQESSDRYVDGDVQNLFISTDPKVVTRLMLPATLFWAQSWLISVQCVSHRITMSCSCLLQLGLGFSH